MRARHSEQPALSRRRSLAIRHVSGHRLIALIEILSPANKDRARHVQDLAHKAVSALERGVHLLLVDLFPPGPHDPSGIHGAILQRLGRPDSAYAPPADGPLLLASYVAGPEVDHLPGSLCRWAIFWSGCRCSCDRTVTWNVPLGPTYQATARGMPAFWRDVLEGRPPIAPG